MSKSLDDELTETLHAIRAIRARIPDELEDYFHDTIVKALEQGKPLKGWLGYLYKSVSRRVACGQEERQYLILNDSLVPDTKPSNTSLLLDIKSALASLSPLRRSYIYEYYYMGYTLDEIAQRHGVTNQVVSKVIKKGLKDMYKALGEKHG